MSRAKATTTQLAHMVEFMKVNHDVASGHGTGLQGKIALEQQWKTLSETLNALGGPVKTVEKWKQTWRDLRNGVKKKAIKNKKEQKGDGPGGTGNGPSQIENFTAQDEAVMSVIGPIAIHGMEGVSCTVPAEDSQRIEGLVMPNILEASSCEPVVVPTSMVVDHLALAPPVVVATSSIATPIIAATPSSQAAPRQRVRSRRRLTTRTESFDSQILDYEKERLEVQKRQIELDEKKLLLEEKRLLIEEAKVEAFQRIATALEQRSSIISDNKVI